MNLRLRVLLSMFLVAAAETGSGIYLLNKDAMCLPLLAAGTITFLLFLYFFFHKDAIL